MPVPNTLVNNTVADADEVMANFSHITDMIDDVTNVTTIKDANGNESIKITATASAVNEITVTNSATGNAVQLAATGDDTNIALKVSGKGSEKVYPVMHAGVALSTGSVNSNSTTWVDVTGATVTITPGVASTMIFHASIDCDSDTAGNILAGRLVLDGVAITDATGCVRTQTNVGYRVTASFLGKINLTAASHTVKMQIQRASGSGNVTATSGNTGFTYFLISQ